MNAWTCRICSKPGQPAFRLAHSCGPCWAAWEARLDAVPNEISPVGPSPTSHPPAAEPRDMDCPGVPAQFPHRPLSRPEFLTSVAAELVRLREVYP